MSNDKPTPVVTPVGELHFVNISGKGKENYNGDGYNYVATIYLSGEKAEGLKSKILEVLGEVPKGVELRSTGFRRILKDAEGNLFAETSKKKEGEDTGITAFTFQTRTTFEDGRPTTVNVYNKDAKKVDLGGRMIGNGSEGAISGKMQRFEAGPKSARECGVSLFLNAIQLTKFVEYSGTAGFEAQEGEFTAIEEAETGFTGEVEETRVETTSRPKL